MDICHFRQFPAIIYGFAIIYFKKYINGASLNERKCGWPERV